MTTSRRYDTNDYHNGMSFHDLNDRELPPRRYSPVHFRPDNQEYQNRETRNNDRYRPSESKKSSFCSKPCLIGLCIGLLIGIILVIAIAVPMGVTRCGTSPAVTVPTTACPTATTIATTTATLNCLGVISSTPNWTGTYLMDDGCLLTASCCCFYNQIRVNQTLGNQLQITGSVTGSCANIGSTASIVIPFPTTFQTGYFWGLQGIRLLLGRDNSFLSFVNTANAYCSATALRTS